MIQEAIEKVEELFDAKIQEIHGQAYAGKELIALPSPSPLAKALEFHSLKGLVAYIASGHDGLAPGTDNALVVDGPEAVRLVGVLTEEFRQREVVALALPYLSPAFPFGRYLDIETFITQLQSSFVRDWNSAQVLKVVGNIQQEGVQTVADDGVSQTVVARAGIARVAEVVVPNPVELRPFRTFPEVEQPASSYILRMKRGDGNLPTAALFEVGDCKWKHEAVDLIAGKIGELLEAAGVKISVFA